MIRRVWLMSVVMGLHLGCRSGQPPPLGKATTTKGEGHSGAEEEKVVVAARAVAQERGYGVDEFEVHAQRVNLNWEVSFFQVTPGVRGGGGFMIRLRDPSLEFVDVRQFQ